MSWTHLRNLTNMALINCAISSFVTAGSRQMEVGTQWCFNSDVPADYTESKILQACAELSNTLGKERPVCIVYDEDQAT